MCTNQASSCCACCAPGDQPAPPWVRIVTGTFNCPPDMYRCLAAWLTICSVASVRKSSYMTSATGRMPCIAAPMAVADERHLGDRRVPHPLRAELVEHPLRDAHRAAHLGDVLAHDEDVVVFAHRLRERVPHGFSVAQLRHRGSSARLRASGRCPPSRTRRTPRRARAPLGRPPRTPRRRDRASRAASSIGSCVSRSSSSSPFGR